MLKHSFCILDGVAEKKEKEFWSKGIHSWEDFIAKGDKIFEYEWFKLWSKQINQLDRLININPLDALPFIQRKWRWRLFPLLRESVGYLDLEMEMFEECKRITCASVWDGFELFQYVQGKNLTDLVSKILSKNMIITYGGKKHDFPLLCSQLGLNYSGLHIDLSEFLPLINVKGGLKSCEKYFNIDRGSLNLIDGLDAIWIWNKYKLENNEKYLDLLLQYNGLDAINLELLMIKAWNQITHNLPFADNVKLDEKNLTRINPVINQTILEETLQAKLKAKSILLKEV
ncbi:MAG: hypothetical protein COA79_04710 [Planctomycetota bacterium]|nr:MAG: hypothetical protein COA79_04710 [Planctomycetota bacterium]